MKNILVVDDDILIVEEICSRLSTYNTYKATSGRIALETARGKKPDLILLDLVMPDMDGFSVLDQLQQHPQLQYIPVILLCSDDSPAFQVRGLKSGVVDFILKTSDCPASQIMDWELLKFRLDIHLQLGEYRASLEHSVSELENNIGLSFAELIEYKDNNYSGHVMRTERYAEFFALALYNTGAFPDFLSLNYIEDFSRAVPFHDIGKIGISEEILRKQGSLNDAELQAARSHTKIGAKILDGIHERIPERSYFKMAGTIARGHHERFNGKGYPDGFSGEDIPLGCRILSVVNVYDACASERVYHAAMSHEDACKEIEKGSGTEFDPKVVEVFLRYKNELAKLGKELKILTDQLGKPPVFASQKYQSAGQHR